jgi:signal transduction histidine kinase
VEDPGAIRVYWDAGAAVVCGDPIGMARAFDNLIANAIEHGSPPLVVTGASVAGRLRVTVANSAPEGERDEDAADPRRGHGVSIVSDLASSHHGRFALCRTGSGCVAALELPLVDAGLARAA